MSSQTPSATALHSVALYSAAAEALAAMLPTNSSVEAVPFTGARGELLKLTVGETVGASFVGQPSAEVALQVNAELLGAGEQRRSARFSTADLLRPALEASTAVFGAGVLSTQNAPSAQALLEDPETVCFELRVSGENAGFFAMRLRDNAQVQPAAETGAPAPLEDIASRLGRINNVDMSLTVEIGRTRMSVRDVLGLEPGAVVELDRSAGAPADILLNGRLIAQGEVVVMDQDYGVRITQILDVDGGPA